MRRFKLRKIIAVAAQVSDLVMAHHEGKKPVFALGLFGTVALLSAVIVVAQGLVELGSWWGCGASN